MSALPKRAASVVLLVAAAAFVTLPVRCTGQGLLVRDNLGATARPKELLYAYRAQLGVARALHTRWQSAQASQGCAGKRGSLCGADKLLSSDEEVLDVMASPAAYDSRRPEDTGGLDLVVRPPGDQGDCNACVAFALAAAAQTAMAAALRVNALDLPRLSPRDLFFCGPRATGVSCNQGRTYEDALSDLVQRSSTIASEECMPWKAVSDGSVQDPCNDQVCDSSDVPKGSFIWSRTRPLDSIAKAMRFIRDHGAVLTSILLYDEGRHLRRFFQQSRKGVYSYTPSRQAPQTVDVPHAILVVGYDATKEYWIAANSFGPKFADGGFFRVGFGQAGVMDPAHTFGIWWDPAESPLVTRRTAPASPGVTGPVQQYKQYVPLKADQRLPPGCLWYISRQGDYASRVASRVGVPTRRLLVDNQKVFEERPGGFLPLGTRIIVCNPDPGKVDSALVHLSPDALAQVLKRNASRGARGGGGNPAAEETVAGLLPGGASPAVRAPRPRPSVDAAAADDASSVLQLQDPPQRPRATLPGEPGALLSATCCVRATWEPRKSHCSHWQGVTCGAGGRVQRIDLRNLILLGDLSTASTWGGLDSLEYIDVSTNRLSGALPSSWSRLGSLAYLDAHDNLIESTLPPSWGDLESLQMLDLSGNRLGGTIPESFGRLSALTTLSLGSNNLVGDIPISLGNLERLEILNISSNHFSGPVPSFRQLPELVTLAIDTNRLSGSFPAAALAQALPNLSVLSVHSNRELSGCLPAAWKDKVEMLDADTMDYTRELTKGVIKGTALTGWC